MNPPGPMADDGGDLTPESNAALVVCPYCGRSHPYPIAPPSQRHTALTRRTANDPGAPSPLQDEREGYAETKIIKRYGISPPRQDLDHGTPGEE